MRNKIRNRVGCTVNEIIKSKIIIIKSNANKIIEIPFFGIWGIHLRNLNFESKDNTKIKVKFLKIDFKSVISR